MNLTTFLFQLNGFVDGFVNCNHPCAQLLADLRDRGAELPGESTEYWVHATDRCFGRNKYFDTTDRHGRLQANDATSGTLQLSTLSLITTFLLC